MESLYKTTHLTMPQYSSQLKTIDFYCCWWAKEQWLKLLIENQPTKSSRISDIFSYRQNTNCMHLKFTPQKHHTVRRKIFKGQSGLLRLKEKVSILRKPDNDIENQSLYYIITLSKSLIAIVKVQWIQMKVYHIGIDLQDVPQENKFRSKGCHSSVSPEDLNKKMVD